MKYVYIFITLIFLSKTSKSQTFVDTTKLWNVLQCYSGPFGSDCETYSYRLSGDTTLGVYQYKKLLPLFLSLFPVVYTRMRESVHES